MATRRPQPAAIRLAVQALDALRAQAPALAAQVKKSLPAFALKQAKAGTAVTVEGLIAAAQLPDFGQTTDTAPKADLLTRYREITGLSEREPHAIDETRFNALSIAAHRGDTAEVVRLLDGGADINASNGLAIRWAADYGHLDTFSLLLERGARMGNTILSNAVYGDNIDILHLAIKHGADIHSAKQHPLLSAAALGRKDMLVALLDEYGVDINVCRAAALTEACKNEGTEIISLLLERGIAIETNLENRENALLKSILYGHNEALRLLIAHGCDVSHPHLLRVAVNNSRLTTAIILLDHGAPADTLNAEEHRLVNRMRGDLARWQRTARMDPPKGLAAYSTLPFKPRLFEQLEKIYAEEGNEEGIGRIYAYQAMALFQSEERILHYLQKWKTDNTTHPLHDTTHMICIPHDLTGVDLKSWGDAVLKHGPKMAGLVKFCNRIPTPLMSDDGKTWSYTKTRAEVAKYAYTRAAEHPELAAFCFDNTIDDDAFETALELTKTPHPPKQMPEITIDGAQFDMTGATFKKLANDDIRGLFLGELTDCCQSIGGHGKDCAKHGFTSPHGGFYAIETAKGEIIGQSWAWRGSEGELCLDSLETLGRRVSAEQWKKLVAAFAEALVHDNPHNVTALHIGTGGRTPPSLSAAFASASAKPKDYNGYRDSQSQIRAWKR